MSMPGPERRFVCGTKSVAKRGARWYVVCATCGSGSGYGHATRNEATRSAVAQSGHPCQARGCGAS